MAHLIDKDTLVTEIEKRRDAALMRQQNLKAIGQESIINEMVADELKNILSFLNALETKEVDLDIKQRIEECPYRQIGCTMYNGHILECRGACSWVVDYPKLKELKAQKGE